MLRVAPNQEAFVAMWDLFFGVDWRTVFVPTIPILESFVRISIVYLSIFLMLRFILKREAAALGVADLLVVVLLADAVQNAMADDYRSVTDGLVLAATLIFWDWALSYAAMRWPTIRPIVRPAPLLLIRDGRVFEANLRREHLTIDELLSHLRLQGVDRVEDVRLAFMEMDGRISVIEKQRERPHQRRDQKAGRG
jgi:uncharacterized membrane protein YcaP (DUF421 family)